MSIILIIGGVFLALLSVMMILAVYKRREKIERIEEECSYLRDVLDSANEGIYVTDRERRFLLWNRMAERITGYRREEILGRRCYDNILAHTDRKGSPLCQEGCPLEKTIKYGNLHGPEIVFLNHKDGRKVPVEVMTAPLRDGSGKIIGGIEVFREVSERLKREREISDQKMKLQVVLDNIDDGVLFVDGDGRISLVNRALQRMLGLGEDILGREIFSLPKDNPLRQVLFVTEAGFGGPYCYEKNDCLPAIDCPEHGSRCCRCWIFRKYGTAPRSMIPCADCSVFKSVQTFLGKPKEYTIGEMVISVLSTFIEKREENEIWEVILFRDVTYEKIDAAMKLAGAAAHELRQPMQVIVGIASMLKEEEDVSDKMRQYCDVLVKSCLRMDDTIERLAKLTKYKLKLYSDNTRILDLGTSSERADKGVEEI
jgi:PAS domain S-box-containing protein